MIATKISKTMYGTVAYSIVLFVTKKNNKLKVRGNFFSVLKKEVLLVDFFVSFSYDICNI
jgi:hypothetical protein